LPKSFFAGSETFFDKSKALSRRFQTHPSGSNSWNRFSSTSRRFMSKKRFNERSKRFSFGQQPVKAKPKEKNRHKENVKDLQILK
jgi:hypothetical protein